MVVSSGSRTELLEALQLSLCLGEVGGEIPGLDTPNATIYTMNRQHLVRERYIVTY